MICQTLLIRYHPVCLYPACDPRKTRFLESSYNTPGHAAARLAVRVPNVMEQAPAALEYPEKLPVKLARIQVSRQAQRWWIMDDPRKRPVFKVLHHLEGVAHHLLDPGIIEKSLGPGIEPGHLLCPRIEFNRDDLLRRFSRLDSGVAQSCRRIQHTSHHRRNSRALPQSILVGIDIFDAVHHKAGDEHTGSLFGWHQAAHAIRLFREYLYGFDVAILDQKTIDRGFVDLLYALPTQSLPVRKEDACRRDLRIYRCDP